MADYKYLAKPIFLKYKISTLICHFWLQHNINGQDRSWSLKTKNNMQINNLTQKTKAHTPLHQNMKKCPLMIIKYEIAPNHVYPWIFKFWIHEIRIWWYQIHIFYYEIKDTEHRKRMFDKFALFTNQILNCYRICGKSMTFGLLRPQHMNIWKWLRFFNTRLKK